MACATDCFCRWHELDELYLFWLRVLKTENPSFTPHPGKAAKREEEGISEAKQTFEREEGVMRETVDKELQKINDLYQERCRDYAQMVSDECESEVSKSSAGEAPDGFSYCNGYSSKWRKAIQELSTPRSVPRTAVSTEIKITGHVL